MAWHPTTRTWKNKFEIDSQDNDALEEYDGITYNHNSVGYRSPEFTDVDLVISGCSQTYGEGVPVECTWASQLAEKLGVSYVNLSVRGASIEGVFVRAMAYLETYKTPKYLFCLLPNSERIDFPFTSESSKYYTSKWAATGSGSLDIGSSGSFDIGSAVLSIHTLPRQIEPEKYIKRPFDLQEVMPVAYIDKLNMDYIRMLERICEAKGVVFRWGTWDSELETRVRQNNEEYELRNFVHITRTLNLLAVPDSKKDPLCHREEEKRYGKNFYRGMDRYGHWGVHAHIHAAEEFLASIK